MQRPGRWDRLVDGCESASNEDWDQLIVLLSRTLYGRGGIAEARAIGGFQGISNTECDHSILPCRPEARSASARRRCGVCNAALIAFIGVLRPGLSVSRQRYHGRPDDCSPRRLERCSRRDGTVRLSRGVERICAPEIMLARPYFLRCFVLLRRTSSLKTDTSRLASLQISKASRQTLSTT